MLEEGSQLFFSTFTFIHIFWVFYRLLHVRSHVLLNIPRRGNNLCFCVALFINSWKCWNSSHFPARFVTLGQALFQTCNFRWRERSFHFRRKEIIVWSWKTFYVYVIFSSHLHHVSFSDITVLLLFILVLEDDCFNIRCNTLACGYGLDCSEKYTEDLLRFLLTYTGTEK